jgi:hypothetical protein
MLDMHRLDPEEEITPLWFDDTHSKSSHSNNSLLQPQLDRLM